MSNGTLGEVRQAIVIGLGQVGSQVLSCLEQRLSARHGGVSTISLLALNAGPDSQERDAGQHTIRRLDFSLDLDALLEEHQADIERWLPDEARALEQDREALAQTRLWGRLALYQHAEDLHDTVREAANIVHSVVTRSELEPKGLRVQDTSSLDLYVIADLSEPFASGALVDLAYLVAHSAAGEVTDRVFPQTTGILFLPSFRVLTDRDELSEAEIRMQRAVDRTHEADAYAALKELDYYMDRRRYEAAFRPGLTFHQDGPPFTHSCYLLDATNERNQGMPDLDQRAEMAGEWLYHMLATPLKDSFREPGVGFTSVRSHGKVAAYSGLGLSAYFVPVKEVIEVNANRLAFELLDRCLLRAAPSGQDLPAADLSVQPQEARDRLQDDQDWDVTRARYSDVPPENFKNIAPHDLTRLEGQIRRTFGRNLRQGLPRLQRGMDQNLGTMIDDLASNLDQKIASIVNASPTGGLFLASRFLHKVKADLETWEGHARADVAARRKELRDLNTSIRHGRASHIAAVKAFGSRWALIALAAALVAILVWLYYAWVTTVDRLALIPLVDLQNTTVAGVVLLLVGLLGIGAAAYIGYDWWRHTRNSYIADHRQRLGVALNIELKEFEARYYRRAQEIFDEKLDEVIEFQDRLEDQRAAFAAEMDVPRPLYGSPRFAIEESLIDKADVDRLYHEVVSKGPQGEILSLFEQHGSFYSWKGRPDEAIASALLGYGRQRFDVLKRTVRAEELLVQHAAEAAPTPVERLSEAAALVGQEASEERRALQRRVEQLVGNSMPFLRYNDLDVDPSVRTQVVHRVGFDAAQNENSPLDQVLADPGIIRQITGDRHRIVSMTVRHGLPLAAVGLLRGWRMQYESLRSRAERPLHTRRSHLALPDIFPVGEDVLQPQMAVALGIAYRILRQRRTDGHYTFRYTDDLGETVSADLGESKIDACVFLQNNDVVLGILSARVEEETVKRGDETDKDGQKRGPRGVADFLRRYERHRRRADALEAWEGAMIDEYVARLEQ